MTTRPRSHPISLAILAAGLLVSAPFAVHAGPPASIKTNPLGLPRLKVNDAAPLAKTKFEEDSFEAPAAGAKKQTQRDIDFLALDGNATWSRDLRGSPQDIVFVSFCANASIGTEFDIAGAVLRVEAAQEPGKAYLIAVGSDGPGAAPAKRIRCGIDIYSGKALAALPVCTIRLDPSTGVWDWFLGTQLQAAGVPLSDEAKKNARRLAIRAGAQGAQLCGLVLADENPLCVDANANGIADAVEIAHAGALLPATAKAADRKALIDASHAAQGPRNTLLLSGHRPLPDRAALKQPAGK